MPPSPPTHPKPLNTNPPLTQPLLPQSRLKRLPPHLQQLRKPHLPQLRRRHQSLGVPRAPLRRQPVGAEQEHENAHGAQQRQGAGPGHLRAGQRQLGHVLRHDHARPDQVDEHGEAGRVRPVHRLGGSGSNGADVDGECGKGRMLLYDSEKIVTVSARLFPPAGGGIVRIRKCRR